MTRLTLLTLFLAFAATSGSIARLREWNEDVDEDAPFARLGQEDGTRFASLEKADEDTLVAELEPVQEEDEQLYAELDSYEEDGDESPSNMEPSEENDEEVGAKTGRGCGRRHRFRNQRRKGERRSSLRRSFAKLKAAKEDEEKSFKRLSKNNEERQMFKKIKRTDGAIEQTDEAPLFAKLEPSEAEDEHLLEDVYDEEETSGSEDDEQELLIQSGGRRRFRQRRKQRGHRGENKRARGLRRQSLGELRQNNKAKRFMKLSKNDEEMIQKFKEEVKKDKERRMHGGRRHGGAAGGCKKSSRICCDGSAPSRNMSAKGWPRKMTCKDGERPVCSVDQCQS